MAKRHRTRERSGEAQGGLRASPATRRVSKGLARGVSDRRDVLSERFEFARDVFRAGELVQAAARRLDEIPLPLLPTDRARNGSFAAAVIPGRDPARNARLVARAAVSPVRVTGVGGGGALAPLSPSSSFAAASRAAAPSPGGRKAGVSPERAPSPKARVTKPRCKPRPIKSEGDGSSRDFVPWCR